MVSRSLKPNPLVFLGIAALSFAVCFVISAAITSNNNESAPENTELTPNEEPPETKKPNFIDLQPTLDEWLSTTSGTKSVIIYDLDNDRVAAEYQPDQTFSTASLYKLFPVYLGYTAVEKGDLDPNTKLASGYTVSQCLDLAIRESNSTCAEGLIQILGPQAVQQAAEEWGTKNTNVHSLQSTPADIVKVLQKYYTHPELSNETFDKILDSMLNQPASKSDLCDGYCDWRQGLPKGFTDPNTKVYNKVGWDYSPEGYWNLYHDAAIVEITSNLQDTPHHYAIVVMTGHINPNKIAALGAKIEQKVLDFAHD